MTRTPVYKVALVRDGSIVSEPVEAAETAARIAAEYIGQADREHVVVLLLNARHKLIGINTVSIGSLSASVVHPREVFKPAILGSAAAIIVAHNHPSGDTEPSDDDRQLTKRLDDVGKMLGIPLLDHLIIGGGQAFSFKGKGLL